MKERTLGWTRFRNIDAVGQGMPCHMKPGLIACHASVGHTTTTIIIIIVVVMSN
jgi:hypothetical protein